MGKGLLRFYNKDAIGDFSEEIIDLKLPTLKGQRYVLVKEELAAIRSNKSLHSLIWRNDYSVVLILIELKQYHVLF